MAAAGNPASRSQLLLAPVSLRGLLSVNNRSRDSFSVDRRFDSHIVSIFSYELFIFLA